MPRSSRLRLHRGNELNHIALAELCHRALVVFVVANDAA